MKTKIKILGVDDLIKNLESLNANVEKASKDAIWKAGAHLEKRLKEKLSHSGTGKEYSTGFKTARYAYHVASAPGQPPAPDTGRLRASITHNLTGKVGTKLPDPGGGKNKVKGYVGTNVDYGKILELGAMIYPFGNPNIKVPLLPRPWLFPTLMEEANAVAAIIRNSLKMAIAKAKKK